MLGQPITVRAGSIGPIGTRRTGQTPSYKAAAQAQAKTARRTKSAPNSTTWVANAHSTWNGCVTDRDRDYDQTVTTSNPADVNLPPGQPSTLFPAEQYGNCPAKMMALSYEWSAMKFLVDSMVPAGNTNQPIGLVWGWQSLVGGGPLTVPPKNSGYQYQDIIITEDRWYQAQTPIDNRMYQNGPGTCANIKAAEITIYTIQVNTDGSPLSTLLKNCASGPDKFFMLTSSGEIVSTFKQIGQPYRACASQNSNSSGSMSLRIMRVGAGTALARI
jgi:hypothetical protein